MKRSVPDLVTVIVAASLQVTVLVTADVELLDRDLVSVAVLCIVSVGSDPEGVSVTERESEQEVKSIGDCGSAT